MLPFHRIIWPTDFSEPSYGALAVAEELANCFSAELILLHVTNETPYMAASAMPISPATAATHQFDIIELQNRIQKQREEELEVARSHTSPSTRTRCLVAVGRPADLIVEIAEREEADLIVIATHGRTGVRHLLFGSVAEKVVRTASCPVLTVHAQEQARHDKIASHG